MNCKDERLVGMPEDVSFADSTCTLQIIINETQQKTYSLVRIAHEF